MHSFREPQDVPDAVKLIGKLDGVLLPLNEVGNFIESRLLPLFKSIRVVNDYSFIYPRKGPRGVYVVFPPFVVADTNLSIMSNTTPLYRTKRKGVFIPIFQGY